MKEILVTKEYHPEFMFYLIMARADLVQFDAWNKNFHTPANDTVTVREMNARMKGRKAPAGAQMTPSGRLLSPPIGIAIG